MKRIKVSGKPIKPIFGMNRVIKDGVLQYKAQEWLFYLPMWTRKLIAKYVWKYEG